MPKKLPSAPSLLPAHSTLPVAPDATVHHDVSSPHFEHGNDRMKLATKPNDGEPLSHRNRSKAGRKG